MMRKANDRLRPCPFCGDRAEILPTDRPGVKLVRCIECGAKMTVVTDYLSQAVVAWNRRREGEWVKTVPTADGYYWWKHEKLNHGLTQVIRFVRKGRITGEGIDCRVKDYAGGGEWMGPLQTPLQDSLHSCVGGTPRQYFLDEEK